jgi:hypothetical protein
MAFSYSGMLTHFCGASGEAEILPPASPCIHIGRFSIAPEDNRLYCKSALSSTESLGGSGNQAHARLRLLLRDGMDRRDRNDSHEEKQCERVSFLHNQSSLVRPRTTSAGYFYFSAGFFQRE